MNLEDNLLPNWIKRQASMGPNVEVDGNRTQENSFWYYLTLCCPLIFDSYAIMLHPFWIDLDQKKVADSGANHDAINANKSLQPISWSSFFDLFGEKFDISTANEIQDKIRMGLLPNWPAYIGFPEEGDCGDEQLDFVLQKIKQEHGDEMVNYYYCLLKTTSWNEEKLFRSKLSDIETIRSKDEIRNNPTAILPDNKSWCIVTDYDLQFTFIGGSAKLIQEITDNENFSIYNLLPVFKEKNI